MRNRTTPTTTTIARITITTIVRISTPTTTIVILKTGYLSICFAFKINSNKRNQQNERKKNHQFTIITTATTKVPHKMPIVI